MHRQLAQLLALLTGPEELAPGIWRAAYGEGMNRFGVEVRDRDGRLHLRVVPADFLPAPVAAHPIVRTRLGRLGDILDSGQLVVDDLCQAVLEVELQSGQQPSGVLEAIHVDCVRLRAAAAGMAAATPHTSVEAASEVELAPPPAPAPSAARPASPGARPGERALPSKADRPGASAPPPPVPEGDELEDFADSGWFAPSPQPPQRGGVRGPVRSSPPTRPPAPPRRSQGPPLEDFPSDLFAAPPRPEGRAADAASGGEARFGGGETRFGGDSAREPDRAAPEGREGRGRDGGRDGGLTRFFSPSPAPPSVPPPPPAPRGADGEPDTGSWGERTKPKLGGFAGRAATVVIIEGPGKGQSFPLDRGDAFCMGRSPHVEIRLEDQVVSRRNSLLTWHAGGPDDPQLFVEDLGSYNGTRVNGTLVSQRHPVQAGDVIEVGRTKLRVEAGGGTGTGTLPPRRRTP